MDFETKMNMLADMFELDVSELSPEMDLDDLEEWDSLAAITYVVMMDETFDKIADPDEIAEFKTVQDILNSMC